MAMTVNESFSGETAWPRLLQILAKPFEPAQVEWKPQATTRDGKRCLAIPYVGTQPYQIRLDSVCPNWNDHYEIVLTPDKVFVTCVLTLMANTMVTRCDVGECELNDPNALTSAKAQAFKRACAAFGLGRYLYDLPKAWVDYDSDKKCITPAALNSLMLALAKKQGASPATPVVVPPTSEPIKEPPLCALHNAPMEWVTNQRTGKSGWVHKTEDGKYCTGQQPSGGH